MLVRQTCLDLPSAQSAAFLEQLNDAACSGFQIVIGYTQWFNQLVFAVSLLADPGWQHQVQASGKRRQRLVAKLPTQFHLRACDHRLRV